jgi:hypothetical protein
LMEVVYALIGILLIAFALYGLWRGIVWIYGVLKLLFILLYCVIRYGPREGWEKFNNWGFKEDIDLDVPAGADIDLDLDL